MPPHPMTQMGLQLFWLRNSGPADSSLASLRRAGCWARRHPRPQLCSLQRPLRDLLPWEQHVGGEVSALLSPLAKNPPNQEASPGTPAGLPCGHVATPGGGRGRDLSRGRSPRTCRQRPTASRPLSPVPCTAAPQAWNHLPRSCDDLCTPATQAGKGGRQSQPWPQGVRQQDQKNSQNERGCVNLLQIINA